MSYELKQTLLLEIENETLKQQVKVLKARIEVLEESLDTALESSEKYNKLTTSLLGDLSSMLGNPQIS